jgi:hypothetical protein
MIALALLVLACAIAWSAWRVTSQPLRLEHAHAVTLTPLTVQPLALSLPGLVEQWWATAREVPEPAPAQSAAPIDPDGELAAEMEATISEGMRTLRSLYADAGKSVSDAELYDEARAMVAHAWESSDPY